MDKTRNFLLQNKESFEAYDYLNDYEVLFKAIDEKVTADHSIEACKSLLEGLAKTIIAQVNIRNPETEKRFEAQDWKNLTILKTQIQSSNPKFQELVRQSILVLSAFHHSCEKDFLLGFSSKYFSAIAKLRDRRGDISHGREVPKQEKSSLALASMIESITDVITIHMLEVFTLIDFSVDNESETYNFIDESFAVKPDADLETLNEKEKSIRQFNEQLDNENPIGDGLRFSEALYYQKQEEYLILLSDYELEQKVESL